MELSARLFGGVECKPGWTAAAHTRPLPQTDRVPLLKEEVGKAYGDDTDTLPVRKIHFARWCGEAIKIAETENLGSRSRSEEKIATCRIVQLSQISSKRGRGAQPRTNDHSEEV